MALDNLKEMLLTNEAGLGFFKETTTIYHDSAEFTNEFYELFAQVTRMKKVMKNPKWIEYMKMTDHNQDSATERPARKAVQAIIELESSLQEIDREFDRINGHDSAPQDDDDDVNIEKAPKGKGF